MAEIHVQRRQTNWWWWMIGLIVLALIVWWWWAAATRNNSAAGTVDTTMAAANARTQPGFAPVPNGDTTALNSNIAPGTGASTVSPASIELFVTFANAPGDSLAMGQAHQYTARGLRHLADAIEALANSGSGSNDVQSQLTTIRQNADSIERVPDSDRHANDVHQAFVAAANALGSLPQASAPNANISDVKQRAQTIDGTRPLLDQKGAVHNFFTAAATSMQAMQKGGAS